MLDGNNKRAMKNTEIIEKIGKELFVKLEQHSWGELAVLKHGSDWHAILRPEHLEKITSLKKGESCNVDDEQGYKWLITNNGDGYNIKSKFGSNKGHFILQGKNPLPKVDWTEPNHLDKSDHLDLKEINKLYKAKQYKEAMNYAMSCDTVIREEIPPDVWKKMGGQLTKTGEDKLKAMKGKPREKSSKKFNPPFYANRKDDENPTFIFSLTDTKILIEALKGDFDLIYLVRRELANRGLDSQGKWVGFDEAKKIHRLT